MELGIKGKNVLIVGASKGIGRAIAIGFAQEKANVVAVARTEDLMKEVKDEALEKGAKSFEYVIEDIFNIKYAPTTFSSNFLEPNIE